MAQNIWEYIWGDDVAEAMHLAGCDEKYIRGNASDFEKFREWISVLTLFENCESVEKCCEKIGVAIGEKLTVENIKEFSASYIWQKYICLSSLVCEDLSISVCDKKHNYISSCGLENTTVDFLKNYTDILDFKSLICGESEEKEKITKKLENPIKVNFFGGEFNRPDRYSAENTLKKVKLGENCNNIENNILLCQLVCETIYAKKGNRPILIFDIRNGSECAEGLIKYLVKRELQARIYLLTDVGVSPYFLKTLCLCGSRNCFVTLFLSQNNSVYLHQLEKIYPRGLIIS